MVEAPHPTPTDLQKPYADNRGCLFAPAVINLVPDLIEMIREKRAQDIQEREVHAKFDEIHNGLTSGEMIEDQLPAIVQEIYDKYPYQAFLFNWSFGGIETGQWRSG